MEQRSCGRCGTQVETAHRFCWWCGEELRHVLASVGAQIAASFDSLVSRQGTVMAHGAALWAEYRRRGRTNLTFSDGAGLASYRMEGKTFRELLPTSEVGHQTGLTAGALWAEAHLALGRDEQAETPEEWDTLLNGYGLRNNVLRNMRTELLELARNGSWSELDALIAETRDNL